MNPIYLIIEALIVLAAGMAIGYFFHRYQADIALKNQQDKAENILKGASEQARLIESQARENAVKIVQAAEAEIKERRIELNKETERLDKRRTELDGRADRLEQREQTINKRQSQVDRRHNEMEKLYEDQSKKLEEIAQMTPDEARKQLFAAVEKEARGDMARIIRQIEAEAREEGEKRARKLIADAIQRVASEHVAEVTPSRGHPAQRGNEGPHRGPQRAQHPGLRTGCRRGRDRGRHPRGGHHLLLRLGPP